MSVVLRLFATIVFIFLLSGIGGGLIGYHQARERIAEEMNAAMTVGRETAHRSVAALTGSFRPEGHLTEFASLFDGDRHLKARLFGPNGSLVKESMPLAPKRQAPAWFVGLMGVQTIVEKVTLPEQLSRMASLTIETVPDNEIEEVWSAFLFTAGLSGMFMVLVLSLVALVVWHSLRPLKPLLAALDKVGTTEGAPDDIEPFGPPEFRQLHAGFNGMSARLKETERRNASLSAQIATVQEEERADLARDLHDEVGPQLFAIDVDASAIRSMVASEPGGRDAEIAARAGAISAGAVAIKQQVRAILARLRPNLAADIGLEQAIADLVAAEQERHPGIRFESRLAADCREPVPSAALYAVAREAVHNALRHAAPRHVEVALSQAGGCVELTVENDGGARGATRPGSQGLRNMRERVEALGGRFAIEDIADPPGVRVRATVPRVPASAPVEERA